jgi:cytochrome c oxidase accessory protein FixG
MRLSPFEHPTAFVVMAVVTAFIFFDFSYFREQTCLVACPYGRFQSVLLDRQSLRVAYDYGRGEPRSKIKEREPKQHADKWGDCIDCRACVMTCPTGVDIRDGLQMECVHCTQCIDACDAVMERVKKPRGLVRYTSQEILEGQPYRWLRFRVIFYPALIVVLLGILSLTLAKREPADIVMLHGGRVAYRTLPNGNIANQIDVRITNRTDQAQRYKLTFKNPPMGMNMIAPLNPLSVAPRRTGTSIVFITSPPHLFRKGGISIRLQVDDGKNFSKQRLFRLLGPPAGIRN